MHREMREILECDEEHASISRTQLRVGDGKMQVPPGPGLGVSLEMDKVNRAAEVYRKCGMRDRDDAGTMRLVEPGWKRELF
jgi:glucarate dehydratase